MITLTAEQLLALFFVTLSLIPLFYVLKECDTLKSREKLLLRKIKLLEERNSLKSVMIEYLQLKYKK